MIKLGLRGGTGCAKEKLGGATDVTAQERKRKENPQQERQDRNEKVTRVGEEGKCRAVVITQLGWRGRGQV